MCCVDVRYRAVHRNDKQRMVDVMEKEYGKLVEELRRERALLVRFEELERKREAEAMASIEGKANAVIELLVAYDMRSVA